MPHAPGISSTPGTAVVSQSQPASLSTRDALIRAWVGYLTLLIIPFLVFLAYLIYFTMDDASTNYELANSWFIASVLLIALAVPAAFFIRSYVFKAYWSGQVVSPRDYLRGMMTVWLTVEFVGVFSLIGCFVTHSLTPNILPALVAFLLFTPFWPSGRAMTSAVGAEDDSAIFRHPR